MQILIISILYTFGHLVLPALIAKNLCREVKTAFWLAPCLTVSASVVGFVIANHWDYPPAQMTVALLSLMLALTWVRRRWRERKTLTVVDSQSAGLGISVQSGAPYQGKDKEGIQKI